MVLQLCALVLHGALLQPVYSGDLLWLLSPNRIRSQTIKAPPHTQPSRRKCFCSCRRACLQSRMCLRDATCVMISATSSSSYTFPSTNSWWAPPGWEKSRQTARSFLQQPSLKRAQALNSRPTSAAASRAVLNTRNDALSWSPNAKLQGSASKAKSSLLSPTSLTKTQTAVFRLWKAFRSVADWLVNQAGKRQISLERIMKGPHGLTLEPFFWK